MKINYQKKAEDLHSQVPPNWYFDSLKKDFFQRIWHNSRFIQVKEIIKEVNGKVLDIGCSDGTFSKIILGESKASQLICIDVSKKSILWAKRHWHRVKNMKFMVGDAHNLKYKSNSFDAVFMLEVLEHVHDPALVLIEIKRVLKKDGYAVFLVPSDSFLFRLVWFLWLHFYPRGWVWRETHIQTYRDNRLTKLCKESGLVVEINKKFNLGMLHVVRVSLK